MKQAPSAYNAYNDLKKHRRKKKWKLYKLAFGVGIDLTISIYLGFFAIIALFFVYDVMQQYQNQFAYMEEVASDFYVEVFVLFLLRGLIDAFRKPGILFSSAELQLSLLPYSRNRLWLYCMLDRWLRLLSITLPITIIVGLVTPFSLEFTLIIGALMILANSLMTIPQWVIYQIGFWYKYLVIMVCSMLSGIIRLLVGFFFPSIITFLILLICVVIVNVILARKALKEVNWMKIVQTNDLVLWNMWFINQMSKVDIKPPKRQGLLQNLFRGKKTKKPFNYENSTSVYRRMWRIYFFEQKEKVFQTVGSIIVILVILSFHTNWLLGLAIALAIFLFGQMSASFFIAGFSEKIVFSLPWDLNSWKKAFLWWIYGGGVIISIVLLTILFIHSESIVWIAPQFVFYIITAIFFTDKMIETNKSKLSRNYSEPPLFTSIFIAALFIMVLYSISYPVLSMGVLLIILFEGAQRKKMISRGKVNE